MSEMYNKDNNDNYYTVGDFSIHKSQDHRLNNLIAWYIEERERLDKDIYSFVQEHGDMRDVIYGDDLRDKLDMNRQATEDRILNKISSFILDISIGSEDLNKLLDNNEG